MGLFIPQLLSQKSLPKSYRDITRRRTFFRLTDDSRLEEIRAFDLDAIAPGRGDALVGSKMVNAAIDNTADFVNSTYRPIARVAQGGGSLKEAWDACREACDPKFGDYARL